MNLKMIKGKQFLMAMVILFGITQVSYAQQEKFKKIQELGGIEEYLYEPNGLELLLLKDNSAPVVTVQIVYRVGSKHEVSGNTGSTHLLEHLMFKGTEKFNKRIGTSIDKQLTSIGAYMNATTWNDRTNYFETIPSDKIELALEIEADRMRNSLLLKEDKDAEMTVVRNEFERGENNPNSVLSKEIWATAYMAHTYHHSTIGWKSDIEKMPIEVLRNFYNTYYWPDNATLTIIGDFDKNELFRYVDKHFGKISKAPNPMPQPYTEEPEQFGPRRVVIKKPGQIGVVNVAYKIPGRMHEDLPALAVLSEILGSGPSSILNREFVDSGLGIYSYADASRFQDVGLFMVGVGISPSTNHDSIYVKIGDVLRGVIEKGVEQSDVERIKSRYQAQSILARDGSSQIAAALTEAIAGGDWRDYVTGVQRINKVTSEDVLRVAKQYLLEDQSTTGYFVPVLPGSNNGQQQSFSNYVDPELGKYYYRHHELDVHNPDASSTKSDQEEEANNFERKEVAGIDVLSIKTGAKGLVSVTGSFSIGSFYNADANVTIPELTTDMLSRGTTKNDKIQFAEKLQKLGVTIDVFPGINTINFGFKCLSQDVNEVFGLLAEELRFPLFDEKEFDLLKNQKLNSVKQTLESPGTRGNIALSQAIYPKDHPNYYNTVEESVKDIEEVTVDDLKSFHKKYFGLVDIHIVIAGDVNTSDIHEAIKASFKGWKGGIEGNISYSEPSPTKGQVKVIGIPLKPSAELYIGQYTGLKRIDPDYLPFYLGNAVLGSGFSGRLMRTVRDESGLTYNISSYHDGHKISGGHWAVNASFNPDLFQEGLDVTMNQLEKWAKEGITQEEHDRIKSNITGSFKVGLATTRGLSNALLNFIELGYEPEYIYQFSKDIEAIALKQTNDAINKYIDVNNLIVIKSGSLNPDGSPMKK